MPFSYLRVKRTLALRLAQIIGTDQATLEAAYTGDWASMLDGAEIPKTAFKDLILAEAKELAEMIGNNAQHPARSLIYGRSADIADLGSTPAYDQNGVEFVGVFDSMAESGTNIPLTWQPTQTIADLNNSFFSDTSFYHYNITGNQVRMTVPLGYLQGCIFDYAAQSTLYDSDGDCPLPESMEAELCDNVTMKSAQVGWTDAAGVAQYFAQVAAHDTPLNQGPNMPLAAQNNPTSG